MLHSLKNFKFSRIGNQKNNVQLNAVNHASEANQLQETTTHLHLVASDTDHHQASTEVSPRSPAQEPSLRTPGGRQVFASGGFSLAPVPDRTLQEIAHKPGKSFFLNEDSAKKAFEMCEASILESLASNDSPRNALHVVILDPVKTLRRLPFEQCVIFEKSINSEQFDINLKTLAREKARVSYENQCDSAEVQRLKPLLYQEGDNKYGGAIYQDGLVVSSAGIEWYKDQLFSRWIAASCEAIGHQGVDKLMNDPNKHFVS